MRSFGYFDSGACQQHLTILQMYSTTIVFYGQWQRPYIGCCLLKRKNNQQESPIAGLTGLEYAGRQCICLCGMIS